MHDVHRAAYSRGLPTCGLSELVHHDVWLPVGCQWDQILGACDAGTAEESRARLDHLLKRIRGPTLVSVSRLRTHLLRRGPTDQTLKPWRCTSGPKSAPVATTTSCSACRAAFMSGSIR